MLNPTHTVVPQKAKIPLDRLNDYQLPSENAAPRTKLRSPQNGADVDTNTINLRWWLDD